MDVKLADGRIIANVPEGTTQSELLRRVAAGDHQQRAAQLKASNPGEYDPASPEWKAKYGPGDAGVWANLGAGFDNLRQGVQQIAGKHGIGPGVTDEDIQEKRRIDAQAADGSLANKGLQVLGEAAPSLILPGGAMVRGLSVLGKTASVLGAGAAANAATAAIEPVTSEESRGQNVALAGALGAVVPGAGSLAGKVGTKLVKSVAETAVPRRAVQALAEYIPTAEREALLAKLDAYQPPTVKGKPVDIPTSATQATGNEYLAQAEAANRAIPETAPGWNRFGADRNAAAYGALEDLAPKDLRMQRLEAVREGRTAPLRQQAMQEAAQRADYTTPVLQHAENMLSGDSGAIPAVKKVANYVQGELGDGNVTPGRMYAMRKYLADTLGGPVAVGDELGAAVKSSRRETMGVISAIDDALAGGQKAGSTWEKYLQEYGQRSAPINSGTALRQTLADIAEKPYVGSTPEVTYTGLKNISNKYRDAGKFGDKLTPADASSLDALKESLRVAEAPGRSRKVSGTMGGGSQTNLDSLLATGADKIIKMLPGIGGYASRLEELNQPLVNAEMARLLKDPQAMAEALRAMPPGRLEQHLIDLMRGGNVTAGATVGAAATP
jgi:hypothetical protein